MLFFTLKEGNPLGTITIKRDVCKCSIVKMHKLFEKNYLFLPKQYFLWYNLNCQVKRLGMWLSTVIDGITLPLFVTIVTITPFPSSFHNHLCLAA